MQTAGLTFGPRHPVLGSNPNGTELSGGVGQRFGQAHPDQTPRLEGNRHPDRAQRSVDCEAQAAPATRGSEVVSNSIPDPPDPELGELAQLYGMKQGTKPGGAPKTSVEPHRFGLADIQSTLAPGAFTQQAIVSKIDKWKALGLDWGAAIAALDKTSGNTTYEQLDCLGLDYNVERLVATFRVKLNGGYSGGPCDNGSKEHIAFWADWDNTCKWTYLDTVSVVVHDFDPIPADGLNYSAVLKVNLDKYRRPCKEPKIGRVRAVLSWNTLPSTTDPDALPYWGNRVDTHVQIRPGVPAEGPLLDGIGGIGVHDIDIAIGGMTKTGARFALTGSFADPWDSTRSCPFGGLIVIQGAPFGTPGSTRYRVLARQVGIAMVPLRITNDIWTVPQGGGAGMWRSADADDAFTYLSAANNYEEVLARWTPSGDELWEIRVQVIDGGGAEIAGTAWHKVQLDNTRPDAELTIDGGACDKYTPGTVDQWALRGSRPSFRCFRTRDSSGQPLAA